MKIVLYLYPKNLSFIEENRQLIIRKNGFKIHISIIVTLFCVIWCGFLVFWYRQAFFRKRPADGGSYFH